VARQCTGETQGESVLLQEVRDFHWRSDDNFEARWLSSRCAPDHLVGVDAVISQWGVGANAYAMLSFGFDDGRQLVFSVGIRKRRG